MIVERDTHIGARAYERSEERDSSAMLIVIWHYSILLNRTDSRLCRGNDLLTIARIKSRCYHPDKPHTPAFFKKPDQHFFLCFSHNSPSISFDIANCNCLVVVKTPELGCSYRDC